MRAYLILTLKWAITLVLAYCIYSEGHTYTAIAVVYIMAWGEAYAILLGNMLVAQEAQNKVLELLISERLLGDTTAMQKIVDKLLSEYYEEDEINNST